MSPFSSLNGDGSRIKQDDSAGTSRLIWDGANVLQETNNAGTTQAEYTMEPVGYGSLISQRRSSTTRWFHFDGLGSADRLSDSGGAVTDSYLYEAFGTQRATSGSTTNRWRFGGRWGYSWDPDLLNYWLRAREYDPALARFLSGDPLGVGVEFDEANLYVYVGDWPTTFIDPAGLRRLIPVPQAPPAPPEPPGRLVRVGRFAATRVVLPVAVAYAGIKLGEKLACLGAVARFCLPELHKNLAEAEAYARQCANLQCGRRGFRRDIPGAKELCVQRIRAMYLPEIETGYRQCVEGCAMVPVWPDFPCPAGLCKGLCCEEEEENYYCCVWRGKQKWLIFPKKITPTLCESAAGFFDVDFWWCDTTPDCKNPVFPN